MTHREVWADLNEQLAELDHQIHHGDGRISKPDLYAAMDRHLDVVLAVRAEETAETIAPIEPAEVAALSLILGLLAEDDEESVHVMRSVLIDLDGDDVVAVVKVLLQILMRQLGVDHTDQEFDHVAVGEDDLAGLAELDGDGVVNVVVIVLKILRHVIGDHHELWRSRIRARLQVRR